MTDLQAHLAAIYDEPFDDAPRLIFADWLEERGEGARAAYVRLFCEGARGAELMPGQLNDAFRRCKPPWWGDAEGYAPRHIRGLLQLEIASKDAAASLGRAGWVACACAEGWVERIRVDANKGPVARLVRKWGEPLAAIPLDIEVPSWIKLHDFECYFDCRRVVALKVHTFARYYPLALQLLERTELREVSIDHPSGPLADHIDRVARRPSLRRVSIQTHAPDIDSALTRLASHSGLRELELGLCPHLTPVGLEAIAGFPNLRRLNLWLWNALGVSEAALSDLRAACAGLSIHYSDPPRNGPSAIP